jgi:hypothetical protein
MRAPFVLRRSAHSPPALVLAIGVAATVIVSLIVGVGASMSKPLRYDTAAAPVSPVPLAGLPDGQSLREPPQAGVLSASLISWLTVRRNAVFATPSGARAAPASCCRSITSRNNPERDLRRFLFDMPTLQRDRVRDLRPEDRALREHPSAALAEAAAKRTQR